MILKFQGIVSTSDYENYSNRSIGGVDFMEKIEETTFKGPVTIAIADQTFTGDLYCDEGTPGYSEFTPGDPAELTLGPHDILDIIDRYDGQTITLWVADEPINTLE